MLTRLRDDIALDLRNVTEASIDWGSENHRVLVFLSVATAGHRFTHSFSFKDKDKTRAYYDELIDLVNAAQEFRSPDRQWMSAFSGLKP